MSGVYTDLMVGQVQVAFASAPGMMPHVNSGRLKGLAVTSARPSALAPGLPPIAASGVPGYDFISPFGIFAPAGTPQPIVSKLNEEIVRVLKSADMKEKLFKRGLEAVGSTPEELITMVKADMEKLGKFITDAR